MRARATRSTTRSALAGGPNGGAVVEAAKPAKPPPASFVRTRASIQLEPAAALSELNEGAPQASLTQPGLERE